MPAAPDDPGPEPGAPADPGLGPEPVAPEDPGLGPEPGAPADPGLGPEPGAPEDPGPGAEPAAERVPGAGAGAPRDIPALPRPRWPGPARALTLLLLAVLGFGGVVAARSADPALSGATADPDRLAASLAAIGTRDRSLAAQESRLRQAGASAVPTASAPPRPSLSVTDGAAPAEAARLAVLAGTVAVSGPGVELTIRDPRRSVDASVLVDALQELRDAGAEAIEIAGVRAAVSTYVADDPGRGLIVDGTSVSPPYALRVIGAAHTLDQALRIPGGVLDTVAARDGAQASVRSFGRLEIRTLRPRPSPRYARPAG